jgi:hypothetical protein
MYTPAKSVLAETLPHGASPQAVGFKVVPAAKHPPCNIGGRSALTGGDLIDGTFQFERNADRQSAL